METNERIKPLVYSQYCVCFMNNYTATYVRAVACTTYDNSSWMDSCTSGIVLLNKTI
jgi:hypothetical protein